LTGAVTRLPGEHKLLALVVLNVLFDERFGGPQSMALQVAQGLRRKSVETIVVIPRGDPALRTLLGLAEVPYRELDLVRLRKTRNPITHVRSLLSFWPNVAALRRLIRETHAQIVHTNGLINLQAAFAARLEGVRLVWQLHEIAVPRPARQVCLPFLRSWADRITVVAQAMVEFYFPDPAPVAARLQVIYPPVDPAKLNPAGAGGSGVRAELGIPVDAPVVGTVANLSPGKGIEYLIEAAPRIRQRFPAARFVVVGQKLPNRRAYWSPMLARVAELRLSGAFIFTGPRGDMPEVYRAMTVYVHPSESEGCPLAVLEASATGLPVVATDVGGTREAVEDGVTGLLIEPRRPSEIADAVVGLLESPALAQTMATAAVVRMEEKFTLDACVREYLQMYHAALGERLEQ
jgi:glycosyltransferase involved in cell wall biosynthesis